mmetsp:Transcript_17373/g.57519  ORF Transcript_17373/g.57519 Transcript_17373/m.57519 type:complete len:156 (-) Transcript_17373:321-788(-)
MQYEDELVYDLAGRLQECLSKFQREGIEINLSLIADHTVVQEAAEEARKGKSSFSSTWERALIDSDLGFCIADEENFKPGMDRLDGNLSPGTTSGQKDPRSSLVSTYEEKAVPVEEDDIPLLPMVRRQGRKLGAYPASQMGSATSEGAIALCWWR